MNPDLPPIHRRFHATISIDADTLHGLVIGLRQIEEDIDRNTRRLVSGGCCAGWHFEVIEDPGMTHERYFQEIEKRNNPI